MNTTTTIYTIMQIEDYYPSGGFDDCQLACTDPQEAFDFLMSGKCVEGRFVSVEMIVLTVDHNDKVAYSTVVGYGECVKYLAALL